MSLIIDISDMPSIWADPKRMGGIPCLNQRRIPVNMILTYLAHPVGRNNIAGFSKDYLVPQIYLEQFLNDLAAKLKNAHHKEIDLYNLLK